MSGIVGRARLLGGIVVAIATAVLFSPWVLPAQADETSAIELDLTGKAGYAKTTLADSWLQVNRNAQDAYVTETGAFRISNALRAPFFSHDGLITPRLTRDAGEGPGQLNTFEASFTLASAADGDGYQEGLNIGIALDDGDWNRGGGNVYFIHRDGKLTLAAFWLDPSLNQGQRPVDSAAITWTEDVFAELDPARSYDIRIVAEFHEGLFNDVLKVYVDDELRLADGHTFEGFAEVKDYPLGTVNSLGFQSGSSTKSSTGLNVISSATARPELTGLGFLFSNISYRSYDRPEATPSPTPTVSVSPTPTDSPTPTPTPTPTPPTPSLTAPALSETPPVLAVPPVTPGVSSDPRPAEVPASIPASSDILEQAPPEALVSEDDVAVSGGTVSVSLGSAWAYQWVYVVFYSEPTIVGWVQADADGVLSVEVPDGLEDGAHSVAAFAGDGSIVALAAVELAAADDGADDPSSPDELATTGSGAIRALPYALLLVAAGVLAVVLVRRRGSGAHR